MTRIAIQHRVRADQGKPILVILNRLYLNVPALYSVAAFAVGSHLSPVDISVAVAALRTDVGKNRFGMALGTGHVLVHATQRELGFVVVELRNVADRLP